MICPKCGSVKIVVETETYRCETCQHTFDKTFICLDCKSNNIITETISHHVPYRSGNLLGITVRIPIRICKHCNNKWLDGAAEDIVDNTLKRIT